MGIGFGTFGTLFAFPGGERVAAVHLMFFARKNEISFWESVLYGSKKCLGDEGKLFLDLSTRYVMTMEVKLIDKCFVGV